MFNRTLIDYLSMHRYELNCPLYVRYRAFPISLLIFFFYTYDYEQSELNKKIIKKLYRVNGICIVFNRDRY